MALEIKDLDPISQGIESIKVKQETTATQVTEVKQLATEAKKEVAAIQTDLTTIKADVETVKSETTEFKTWRLTKDEADKLNQDALDKLIADKKTTIIPGDQPVTFQSLLSDALTKGDGYEKLKKIANNDSKREKRFTIELKIPDTVTVGNVTGSLWSNIIRPGIIEVPKRKVHLRDLLPIGNVGPGTNFVFMRENGTGEGAIAPTAENTTKPQFDLDLIEADVKIETIAGYMIVTRKAMNNIPGFLSYMQSRLPELFLRAEDTQLISGDGISPNLSGILDAGNFTAATSTAAVLIEQLIDSLAQLEDDEERYATGILLRPVDYYSFFKNKASGSGEYDLPSNVTFQNGTLYVSGIPVYESTAVPAAKYIVGDFQMGAQLLIQEGMRIEFFEQDDINVRKNLITVRIEGTECFPIYGDNYFIAGDVPGGS